MIRKVYGEVFDAGLQSILPLQHPAAVLHDPRLKPVLVENYRKLGKIYADRVS